MPAGNTPAKTPVSPLVTNIVPNGGLIAQQAMVEIPAIGSQAYGANVTLQAVVVGKQDNQGVANANVSFSVDGKVIGNVSAGPGGIARLDYKLDVDPGSHTVEAQFTPSAGMRYQKAKGDAMLTVTKANVAFRSPVSLVWICEAPYGNPCDKHNPSTLAFSTFLNTVPGGAGAAGVPVIVRVLGTVRGTPKTDANGEVVLNLGSHTETDHIKGSVEFPGDKHYAPATLNF